MTTTRTIKRTPSMPPWARWRATDECGQKWLYQRKPSIDLAGWYWCSSSGLAFPANGTAKPCRTWRQSLRRIVSAGGGK